MTAQPNDPRFITLMGQTDPTIGEEMPEYDPAMRTHEFEGGEADYWEPTLAESEYRRGMQLRGLADQAGEFLGEAAGAAGAAVEESEWVKAIKEAAVDVGELASEAAGEAMGTIAESKGTWGDAVRDQFAEWTAPPQGPPVEHEIAADVAPPDPDKAAAQRYQNAQRDRIAMAGQKARGE